MEATTAIVLTRAVIALGLLMGALTSLWFGFLLYTSGAGLKRGVGTLVFKTGKLDVSTSGVTVGAVMMLSSVGWAYFTASSAPRMEVTALGGTTISQKDIGGAGMFAQAVKLLSQPVELTGKNEVDRLDDIAIAARVAAKAVSQEGDGVAIYAWPSPGKQLDSTIPLIRAMSEAASRAGSQVSKVVVMTPDEATRTLHQFGTAVPSGTGGLFASPGQLINADPGAGQKSGPL